MLVRNIDFTTLEAALAHNELEAEVSQKGKDWHVRPKRQSKAVRIVPKGTNYYLTDYGVENGRAWTKFQNRHIDFELNEKLKNSTTLGNADWYDFISELLSKDAVVKVGNTKFHSQFEYDDWCSADDSHAVIEAERELRKELASL